MTIPKQLQGFFLPQISGKKSSGITAGTLACCTNKFQVFYSGNLESGIWGSQYFQPDNNGLSILCRCTTCGKDILVFDSNEHGYDACTQIADTKKEKRVFRPLFCSRCKRSEFEIDVSFEFPPEKELEEDDFSDPSNAFTWIWSSITCMSCGKRYRKILDFETG